MEIDLAGADDRQLDARLLRDFRGENRDFANARPAPAQKLIPVAAPSGSARPQGERGHAGGRRAFAALLKALLVSRRGCCPSRRGGHGGRRGGPRSTRARWSPAREGAICGKIDVDALTGATPDCLVDGLLAAKGVNRNG
ncbi:MAG: hypothetical protein ACLVL7_08025 [Anaerotruncus massiliensis (ex Togo et al. 2019)]